MTAISSTASTSANAAPKHKSNISALSSQNVGGDAAPAPRGLIYQYRGVLWLLLAEFISSIMALLTRYLLTLDASKTGRHLHALNIISWRMPIGFATCLAMGWWNKVEDFPLGHKDLRPVLMLRGLGGFVAVTCLYCQFSSLSIPPCGSNRL